MSDRSTDPDYDSVCAAKAGDPGAFSPVVTRYTNMLYTLALRSLGNSSDAEDAVQEIFTKAYQGLKNFDENYRFFPWLYSIAVNHLRSVTRRSTFRVQNTVLPISEELLEAPGSGEPEAQLLASESRRVIQSALEELTPDQRRVFLLRQLQSLSTQETAEVLNIPQNTVKTLLRRARARVAETITKIETPE